MRVFVILCAVVIALVIMLYGTRLFVSEPVGQPSPHALDQSE